MRLKSSLLISALCWTARLVSAVQVYTFDPESEHLPGHAESRSRTLTPPDARLVLAQRAGVEDYHLDALLSPNGIDAINEFGWREDLFHQNGEGRTKRYIALVDGWDGIHAALDSLNPTSHFETFTSPTLNATQSLFVDLARQKVYPETLPSSDTEALAQLGGANSEIVQPGAADDVRFFYYSHKFSNDEILYQLQNNARLVRETRTRVDPMTQYSITVIVGPSTPAEENDEQRGGKHIWGSYSMPTSNTPMIGSPHSHLHIQKRQDASPLENNPITPLQDDDTNPNSTAPLPGILPACFSTRRACIAETRNCTGHGTCSLLWTDKDVEEPRTKPCYACSCTPSTITSTSPDGSERTQTIYWGGPACQKRDVSSSFWLIAGLTVAMVGLISFAVGGLMGVGGEELPSVIGAGVSGVGARGQQGGR